MARGQIFHDKQTSNRKKCEKNKELALFIFIPYQTQLLHKNRQGIQCVLKCFRSMSH